MKSCARTAWAVCLRDAPNDGGQNAGAFSYTQNGRIDLSGVAEHAIVENHDVDWTTVKKSWAVRLTPARGRSERFSTLSGKRQL